MIKMLRASSINLYNWSILNNDIGLFFSSRKLLNSVNILLANLAMSDLIIVLMVNSISNLSLYFRERYKACIIT